MRIYDVFRNMSIDQLVDWLDKYGEFDGSPWMKWFGDMHCKKCEPILCHYPESTLEFPVSYCELEHKCRFFPDMDHAPDNKETIKMWLNLEFTEKEGM